MTEFASLRFERVSIRRLRNIDALDFEPAPRLNVIVGDNGQGKTSLLEALYFVATTKSFRSERLAPIVQTGAEQAVVTVTVSEADARREQRTVVSKDRRAVLIDGKHPSSLSLYATRTPIVAFHPADLELVSGSATPRRTLLDRIALYVDPPSGLARIRYQKALRERQKALEERGTAARELIAFEAVMAEEGARLALARERAWEALSERLGPALANVAAPETRVSARYVPGGTKNRAEFAGRLVETRALDLRRGTATFGPQRDELELSVDDRPARQCASQGQQRLITLALKFAELECIRQARGAHPVLLLDDVSSELDPERTRAVAEWLRVSESQVFVTTTRRDLFADTDIKTPFRADFSLLRGALQKVA
ncbi:MAG TPA: DNA replication and repair protein RecF [Polyangiaceae bacterium]|nr:DNA replication and repair protein RecF [Polyangiaceae bacterium]